MKLKQILAIVLSMALVACISVAATVAYLTSVTETVTNTFTIGDIEITLDEAEVNKPDATNPGVAPSNAPRVTENDYQLFPGSEYDKDPTVHVQPGSEASYIFVKVTDNIASLEDAKLIYDQIIDHEWIPFGTLTGVKNQDGWTGVFYKKQAKVTGDKAVDLVVFDNFKIKTNVTSDILAKYEDETVVINAYAIQQANLTVEQAWEQVKDLTPSTDGNATQGEANEG